MFERYTNEDGDEVVLVPVQGGEHENACVRIERYDWSRLRVAGLRLPLRLVASPDSGRAFVTSASQKPGVFPNVARLLLGARRDQRVTYIDGSPLNLTRANLRLVQWQTRERHNTLKEAPCVT
jgi:hypothetical protein